MGDLPSAVALAVPVPDPKDPVYPAFVVLATRLAMTGGYTWKANFAPLARPDILLVTSPFLGTSRPRCSPRRCAPT